MYYDLSSAVSSDSSQNSAPIVRQVLKPSDMSYSSAIVYNKGATIIRMMEFAMGADNFRNGIRKYLKKYEYQTVVTKNLWDSLNETFPKVNHIIMNSGFEHRIQFLGFRHKYLRTDGLLDYESGLSLHQYNQKC